MTTDILFGHPEHFLTWLCQLKNVQFKAEPAPWLYKPGHKECIINVYYTGHFFQCGTARHNAEMVAA
jgi:hypothetical protein